MWSTAPVSWVIAKILDIWLGEHTFQRYDNDQLKKLVHLHSRKALSQVQGHLRDGIDGLTIEQAKMIEGAITFQEEPCDEVMTKISRVKFTLELDAVLDSACLKRIKSDGHSRIPIIGNGNDCYIIAYLLTKSLIGLDTSEQKTIRQLFQEKEIQVKVPLYLHEDTTLGKIVKSFQ